MQHHSQSLVQGLTAGKTEVFTSNAVSAAEIERHMAAAKLLQARAVADFCKTGLRRLGALLHLRPQGAEHLSRA